MSTDDSSENEKEIFESINKNDLSALTTLLNNVQNVNFLDENSMSPLQHAAYKGNKEMVQLLLDRGADVNLCRHQHGYTALHFAGLSGNADVCSLLLLSGAKAQAVNSVSRTPAQMAAFVGNHICVSTINNFIPKSDIDYFTQVRGQQTVPTLPAIIADSFHKFAMQINVHPVRIILNLHKYVGLSNHLDQVKSTLESMCEKEMKKGSETNEVMSFKFHYLAYIVGEIGKLMSKSEEPGELPPKLQELAKRLLKPGKDGNLEYMDAFLREGIRNFPYRECTIFKQMVSSLTSKDPPSALGVAAAAINGHRGFIDNVPMCRTCGEEKPLKKCSKCKAVQYCDRECQRIHWPIHKKTCARVAQTDGKPTPAEITADMQNLLTDHDN